MTKPESLPVEEARKKFADILDGTQFRSTHTEITRRGKAAGVVVPPEWYEMAIEALAAKRPESSAAATPGQQVPQPLPNPEPIALTGIPPEVAALSMERVRSLSASAEARQPQWVAEIREEYPDANELQLCYLIVDTGFRQGRKPPELAEQTEKEPTA